MFALIGLIVVAVLVAAAVGLYMNRDKLKEMLEKEKMQGSRIGVFMLDDLAKNRKALASYNEPCLHAGSPSEMRLPADARVDVALIDPVASEDVKAGFNVGPMGVLAVEESISRPPLPGAAGGFQISTTDTWVGAGQTRESLEKSAALAKACASEVEAAAQWGQPKLF